MNRFLIVLCCAVGPLFGSSADAATYAFSSSGSRITFTMSATLHDIDGSAKSFKGSLDTDAGTGSLTIDATSLTTGLGPRDTKMHDFCLESGTYGEMGLEVTSITGDLTGLQSGQGSGKITLNGNLTIRDMVLEVAIPVDYGFEGEELSLRGSHRMSWTTFGVPDPSILISKLAPSMKVKFKIKAK